MPVHLNHDLSRLKKNILEYSAAIDQNFSRAMKALEEIDGAAAIKVINHDRELDKREVEIEDECLKILALHQPVARDLRFVVTVLKMNNDLERIGDFAVNIAKRALHLAHNSPITIPPKLIEMGANSRAMVARSLDAIVEGDSKLARAICADDDEVDRLGKELYREFREAFQTDQEHLDQWMQLFLVIRYIERVGDLATNIAEDVIYLVEGEVIRHMYVDDDED